MTRWVADRSPQSPTAVNDLATNKPFHWFERTVIHRVPGRYPGAGRRVTQAPAARRIGHMNPDRHAQSHWGFYLNLVRGDLETQTASPFYHEYNAVSICRPTTTSRHHHGVPEVRLPIGIWDVTIDGKTNPRQAAGHSATCRCCHRGELDDISGVGQTRRPMTCAPVFALPAPAHQHLLAKGRPLRNLHGRRWREIIYPYIRGFIADAAKPRKRKSR